MQLIRSCPTLPRPASGHARQSTFMPTCSNANASAVQTCMETAAHGHRQPGVRPQHMRIAAMPDMHDMEAATRTNRTHRRAVLLATAAVALAPNMARAEVYSEDQAITQPDTTITNLVYFDISIAPRSFKTAGERTLGDRTVIPLDDSAPVGRIVLGLYGNTAPGTVSNFLRLVRSGALKETVFSRVLPGEYIQAGQQGAFRLGQVEADQAELQPNPDLSSPSAFRLRHLRPGTLSLSLAENDEDPQLRMRSGYRNSEFLITTGPGPVPRLDSANLVFGRVVEGMSVVSTIAQVPTFKPSERSKQLNIFAQSIGDDRAATVRRKYGKPLKAVIIMDVGELPLPAAQQAPATVAAAPAR